VSGISKDNEHFFYKNICVEIYEMLAAHNKKEYTRYEEMESFNICFKKC